MRELLGERGVGVVEDSARRRPVAAIRLQYGLVGRDVIRVVGADDLNLVQVGLAGQKARADYPSNKPGKAEYWSAD